MVDGVIWLETDGLKTSEQIGFDVREKERFR